MNIVSDSDIGNLIPFSSTQTLTPMMNGDSRENNDTSTPGCRSEARITTILPLQQTILPVPQLAISSQTLNPPESREQNSSSRPCSTVNHMFNNNSNNSHNIINNMQNNNNLAYNIPQMNYGVFADPRISQTSNSQYIDIMQPHNQNSVRNFNAQALPYMGVYGYQNHPRMIMVPQTYVPMYQMPQMIYPSQGYTMYVPNYGQGVMKPADVSFGGGSFHAGFDSEFAIANKIDSLCRACDIGINQLREKCKN
eukprot:TRINITY_DN1333_c0_g2_i4.p1 TRINITY_DN1333_c0_g2~~TRINITY_DN1333_c0_g2_i4.p1  ORF type:complete len:252 (+),score=18.75 TRINITY_DN1333_c0_g2_i4:187-942(+)